MEKEELLKEVDKKVAACRKCPLYKTATNPVPGNGNFEAEIIFIGEAPGFHEDQRGIPFCGAAGKLLDRLLSSIGLDRSKVYVANMLKHRPPNNRDPSLEEMEACREYLDEQIKIINPKAIVTLGRFSMVKFYPFGKISADHGKGKIVEYNGREYIFIPMYHPAAALRAGAVDAQLREDFIKMPEEIKRLEKIINGVVEVPIKQEEEKEEQLGLI